MNLKLKHYGKPLNEAKFRVCILVGLMLVGCSSSTGHKIPETVIINHTVSDASLDIDESDIVDLYVTGDRNTITITAKTFVARFALTGSNNLITFKPGAKISTFHIDGDDNTIQQPVDLHILSLFDNGAGNTIIVI
jgi:hypothetical protein